MPVLTTEQWKEIEKHFRVGKRTLRDIGEEFGVAHVTICKKAKKLGWVRDLNAAINAKADEILQKQALENNATKQVGTRKGLTGKEEGELITANATLQASIRSAQMKGATANREMVEEQIEALRLEISCKKEFGELADLMRAENPDIGKASKVYNKVLSFGSCVDNLKKLMELWIKLVDIERKVYGVDRVDESGKGEWKITLSADEANL